MGREVELITIGLGTGRCGTKSLAALLNAQINSVFFHEMNASNLMFEGTERPILNSIDEFDRILKGGDKRNICVDLSDEYVVHAYNKLIKMDKVDFIGDVASYYLKYVPIMIMHHKNVRFICMRRGKKETVHSFLKKVSLTKTPQRKILEVLSYLLSGKRYYQTKNHWMNHDGTIWQRDLKFDKLFPKFIAADIEDAVSQYWDMYYKEAELLAMKYPENIKIFELENMNSVKGQKVILQYAGFKEDDMVIKNYHENKLID